MQSIWSVFLSTPIFILTSQIASNQNVNLENLLNVFICLFFTSKPDKSDKNQVSFFTEIKHIKS